ncbi:MAG: hypothetical protein R3C15_11170 [Thermoleophilia bacterium]
MTMIAALLAALIAGVTGLARCGAPTDDEPTEPVPTLTSITLDRTGGFAPEPGGTRWQITDPGELAELAPLVPVPLPPSNGEPEPTGCADCFEYVLTIETPTGTFTGRWDDVSLPGPFSALVSAISALEPTGPAEPLPPSVPAPPSPEPLVLTSVTLIRTGGVAGPRDGTTWSVIDEAQLAALAAITPQPLPPSGAGTSECADCYQYSLAIGTTEGSYGYSYDDATLPDELRALVDAVAQLEPLGPPIVN